jgi:DNA-directed RNA polymerase subunit H (RpoH/RPB5)
LSTELILEERKARILIKLRGYKLVKRQEEKDTISFFVRAPKEKARILLWCIPTEGTVGVAYVNNMSKAMKKEEIKRGIVVTSGRYTQAAKVKAAQNKIELIPRIFPAFNIFDHELVPKHEILSSDERKRILSEYRVQPYQLPRIMASDPAVKAIGARPGDIVRVIRDSSTAGKYTAYRYVVED